MRKVTNEVIRRAIDIAGSQAALARKTGATQPTVSKWLNGSGIRSRFIQPIAAATGGKISPSEILNSLTKPSQEEV